MLSRGQGVYRAQPNAFILRINIATDVIRKDEGEKAERNQDVPNDRAYSHGVKPSANQAGGIENSIVGDSVVSFLGNIPAPAHHKEKPENALYYRATYKKGREDLRGRALL